MAHGSQHDRAAGAASLLALVLFVVSSAAGCSSPSYGECSVRCGDGAQCPSGLSCGPDGFCHETVPEEPEALCVVEIDAGDANPDADPNSGDAGAEEICDDNKDNTGNGQTDCADPDCADFPGCCETDNDCAAGENCVEGYCDP